MIVSLYRDYCFLASGYLLEECHFNYLKSREYGLAKSRLPANIAKPLCYLADIQNAKPWLDYSRSYMNFNYKKRNTESGVEYDNMDCIRTFSDMAGEPGFILTHVAIDGFSPKVVELIEDIFVNVKQNDRKAAIQNLKLLN